MDNQLIHSIDTADIIFQHYHPIKSLLFHVMCEWMQRV